MTQAFQQKRWRFLNVKGTIFSNPKVHGNRSNMITLEDRANVLFGRVGNILGELSHGFVGSTRIPLFLAGKVMSESKYRVSLTQLDDDRRPLGTLSRSHDDK